MNIDFTNALLLIIAFIFGGFLLEAAKDLYKRWRGKNQTDEIFSETICRNCKIWGELTVMKAKQSELRETRLPILEKDVGILIVQVNSMNTKIDKLFSMIEEMWKRQMQKDNL